MRDLRASHRTDRPVRLIRREITPDHFGELWEGRRCYYIVLNTMIDCANCERETIVHEYAHAVQFHKIKRSGKGDGEHGPAFGIAYARSYRHAEPE